MALEKYPDAVIYRSDTGSEHPDNERFMRDCEKWFGKKVNVLKSELYSDIWEVFDAKKMLATRRGYAPCTSEMKRVVGDSVWNFGDIEIFGYTVEEKRRVERWQEHNNERIIECPLVERGYTKEDCFGLLERVGIELPEMYKLGFRNNNCIGCVKAQDNIDYWKRIRKHFPDKFEWMAKKERELGFNLNRKTISGERLPVYLDEIEDGEPRASDNPVTCGLFCMADADSFQSNK